MKVSQPFAFPENYRVEGTRQELASMLFAINEVLSREDSHAPNYCWTHNGFQGLKPSGNEIQIMLMKED